MGTAGETATTEELREPLRPRPYLLAREIPWLLAQPSTRGKAIPLRQFVKDWFSPLANHDEMIADPLPSTCPAGDAVRIATVVHALCDQEGLQAPSWVFGHRWDEDEMLVEEVPWDSELGAWEREDAPPACRWHRCWFGRRFFEVLGVHAG